MKKQIAKTISILSLFIMLSVGASNVSAFPTCPGCKPKPPVQYAVSASAQNVTQAPARGLGGQETVPTAPPENSFSFAFFLVQLAMGFLYLP
jgi:hypothetical protein